jgi:hypothetical protein
MSVDQNGYRYGLFRRMSELQRCLGGFLFAILTFPAAAQPADKQPKDATEWFQRAADQMNLRAFGSTPFHIKVVFHPLPGIVLSKKESDQIISGDGTYEETWVAPHKWRREVTLGSYHAVEVESEAGRKMRATSDYEPSRALMLLEALLYPIPGDLSSPSLAEKHLHWEIESGAVGNLSYAKISRTSDDGTHAYLFLPNGELVQSIERGIVTDWQGQVVFAGRLVPQHIRVQGGTRDLVTADVTVEPAGAVDAAVFQLPGQPAEPGMTLRPLHKYEYHFSIGVMTHSYASVGEEHFRGITREILDRHGMTKEVEILYSPNPEAATDDLLWIRSWKLDPATIDKNPCEIVLTQWTRTQ